MQPSNWAANSPASAIAAPYIRQTVRLKHIPRTSPALSPRSQALYETLADRRLEQQAGSVCWRGLRSVMPVSLHHTCLQRFLVKEASLQQHEEDEWLRYMQAEADAEASSQPQVIPDPDCATALA